MLRPTCLILAIVLPLSACSTAGGAGNSPENKAVSAVVLDESKRQEAAQAATATKSADDALDRVTEGPKDQAPVPN